jgi:glycine/D-amino acid oxidase-like deaminating enzyme/nitrite reductase/ring-hydroxylating ferredoxin subunit
LPTTEPLRADVQAGVCVIGAGIAGLTTAYLLGREGKSVVVLDDGPIGGGETSRTTAHLACRIDDGLAELEEVLGLDAARLAVQSHSAAIDRMERIADEEGIDCDFVRLDAWLFLGEGQPVEKLDREFEAARRAGLAVQRHGRAPVPDLDVGPALCFARQGQFHAMKYLAGLAAAAQRHGVRIFTGTRAKQSQGGSDAHVQTEAGPVVRTGAIVVATNSPINDVVTMHTKLAPYRTYVVAASVPEDYAPQALYWDMLDPYHYVRLQRMEVDGRRQPMMVVGGEDHKTGQAQDMDDRYGKLEEWMRQRWSKAGPVQFRWSGQVLETLDGLGYIGRNPGDEANVFIATGDSGMGMTHGTIAGLLIGDLAGGRGNPWEALYDPSRKSPRAIRDYLAENLNVARQYADYVTGGDVRSVDEIQPGQGAILRRGLGKVAVYRDEQGQLHEFSAVCPHVGCIVQWNPGERTWDCPCHGSRFTALGQAVNGPTYKNLDPAEGRG